LRLFLDLTKFGIVCFILISGCVGYALSMAPGEPWVISHLVLTLATLYFLSAGSFALNQAQEWMADQRMRRTVTRPIPSGKVTVRQAWLLGSVFVVICIVLGFAVNPLVALLGALTVLLYNVLYTLYWKKKWAFGAVPGAIPGAMPVVIGYAANTNRLFQPDLIYAFLIMFLWQMPHFWSLAIRFKEDYSKAGFPVLPVIIGTGRTLFHMGLYVFAYVGLALASPWFTSTYVLYFVLVVPFAFKVLYEFYRFQNSSVEKQWLPFFLWTNFSVLVFLIVPVLDKWCEFIIARM